MINNRSWKILLDVFNVRTKNNIFWEKIGEWKVNQGIKEKIHTDGGEPIKPIIKFKNSKEKIKFVWAKRVSNLTNKIRKYLKCL